MSRNLILIKISLTNQTWCMTDASTLVYSLDPAIRTFVERKTEKCSCMSTQGLHGSHRTHFLRNWMLYWIKAHAQSWRIQSSHHHKEHDRTHSHSLTPRQTSTDDIQSSAFAFTALTCRDVVLSLCYQRSTHHKSQTENIFSLCCLRSDRTCSQWSFISDLWMFRWVLAGERVFTDESEWMC